MLVFPAARMYPKPSTKEAAATPIKSLPALRKVSGLRHARRTRARKTTWLSAEYLADEEGRVRRQVLRGVPDGVSADELDFQREQVAEHVHG
jgi:hypothetical protein